MKNLLDKKTANVVLALLIAALAVYAVWNLFDVSARFQLSSAIGDILDYRDVPQARKALREVEDRGMVVSGLKAAVDEDTPLVQGKLALLDTLLEWQEPRAARRALGSKSVSSQRAAAWKFHSDKSAANQVKQITLGWVKDESADSRDLAALIATKLKLEEVLPVMEKAVMGTPETVEEVQFAMKALDVMREFKSPNLAKRALEIAGDEKQHVHLRARAFDLIGRLKDQTSTADVQAMLIGTLKNRDGNDFLRKKAALVLHGERFGNETTWAALEEVLLRKGEDGVLQRNCLTALSGTAPLDKIRTLLLDRRVYQHAYFGVRIDVCTGLATLNVQERLALEILCQLMEDRDKDDLALMVPQEAWLSYWALTGDVFGVAEKTIFKNRPRQLTDEARIREYLWKPAQLRIGVNATMVQAVQRMVCANYEEVTKSSLRGQKRPAKIRRTEDLKNIADSCRNNIAAALARIKKQREKAEQKKKDAEKKKVDDQGPKKSNG